MKLISHLAPHSYNHMLAGIAFASQRETALPHRFLRGSNRALTVSRTSLFFTSWTSLGISALSLRSLMNNGGYEPDVQYVVCSKDSNFSAAASGRSGGGVPADFQK